MFTTLICQLRKDPFEKLKIKKLLVISHKNHGVETLIKLEEIEILRKIKIRTM